MTRKTTMLIDGVSPRFEDESADLDIKVINVVMEHKGEDIDYMGIMLSIQDGPKTAEICLPAETWRQIIGALSRRIAKNIPANNR